MELQDYLRFVLALALVLGLIAALAWTLRRTGFRLNAAKGRRLSIVESVMLSPRHRLMLIRRDQTEHLLLIGPNGQIVVESAIKGQKTQESFADMIQVESGKP